MKILFIVEVVLGKNLSLFGNAEQISVSSFYGEYVVCESLGGIGIALVGGGFIEMKAILDNSLKTEQEKAKAAGKEKKRKNYTKK